MGDVTIFNPQEEDFAGYALVGASCFITKVLGKPISYLKCRGSQVKTREENGLTWIRAELKVTPPWHHQELSDAASINNFSPSSIKEHTIVWAWIDKDKGIIRARTFAPDWGIPEDEANGSGSMQLASRLNRKLEIHHGKGSVIYARLATHGFAEAGGRVKVEKVKT